MASQTASIGTAADLQQALAEFFLETGKQTTARSQGADWNPMGDEYAVRAVLTQVGFETDQRTDPWITDLCLLTDRQASMVKTAILIKELVKLRQIEKAVHFIERRSDSAASIPSEVQRHYDRAVEAYAQAASDGERQAVAQQWKTDWYDAVWLGFSGGCFAGLIRLFYLKRRLD